MIIQDLIIFIFGSWASIQNGASSSWALSREPLKFRLNFRNGSPGTSTRGEEFVTKVVKGNQFWHNAHTAPTAVALIAQILLCSALMCFSKASSYRCASFYSGNSAARLVIWWKSGYCKVQKSLTKKSPKDWMEKCYIPEAGLQHQQRSISETNFTAEILNRLPFKGETGHWALCNGTIIILSNS